MTSWTAACVALAAVALGAGGCGGSSTSIDRSGDTAGDGSVPDTDGARASSCPPPTSTACASPAPSFAADISPILERSCDTCHSMDNTDGIWPLHEYVDVAAWSDLIISDLLDCSMPPPDSGTSFPESDRQKLFAWLACGSPND